jgi:dTDP-L-rhamnose 4-epimerase
MPRDSPYSGVAAIFRSALERGEPPRVFEDGRQRRDFVHVRDVAAANLAALRAVHEAPGVVRAYNVASGQPRTVGEMASALAAATGGPAPIITGQFRAGDVRHVAASPRRARDELGFTPSVAFAQGWPGPRGRRYERPLPRPDWFVVRKTLVLARGRGGELDQTCQMASAVRGGERG